MFWDWSRAGKDTHVSEKDPYCITLYKKKKGLLIKRKNVQPVYAWYNGTFRRYLAGDPVNLQGVTDLNSPVGEISDPRAKITPYKLYQAVQPADGVYGYLIVPNLWGGFWKHFDWNQAAKVGMKAAGLKYSGKVVFVKTRMYWRINHGVVPKGPGPFLYRLPPAGRCHGFQGTGIQRRPCGDGSAVQEKRYDKGSRY